VSVSRCAYGKLVYADAAQLREPGADGGNLVWRVALAVKPGRGDIRRIGLDDKRIEWQLRRETADLQGALERQVAAETEMHALIEKRLGLLKTAVEGMGNAAMHAMLGAGP